VNGKLVEFVALNGGIRVNGELHRPEAELSYGRTRFRAVNGRGTVVLDRSATNAAITTCAVKGVWTRDQNWRRP